MKQEVCNRMKKVQKKKKNSENTENTIPWQQLI